MVFACKIANKSKQVEIETWHMDMTKQRANMEADFIFQLWCISFSKTLAEIISVLTRVRRQYKSCYLSDKLVFFDVEMAVSTFFFVRNSLTELGVNGQKLFGVLCFCLPMICYAMINACECKCMYIHNEWIIRNDVPKSKF